MTRPPDDVLNDVGLTGNNHLLNLVMSLDVKTGEIGYQCILNEELWKDEGFLLDLIVRFITTTSAESCILNAIREVVLEKKPELATAISMSFASVSPSVPPISALGYLKQLNSNLSAFKGEDDE